MSIRGPIFISKNIVLAKKFGYISNFFILDLANDKVMKAETFLKEILKRGSISNELELEKAFVLERKLRLMSKDHPVFIEERKALRRIIKLYESANWSKNSKISDEQIELSNRAEAKAEQERNFIEVRKALIKQKLERHNMTQQDLGELLGHGKTYMSELMNGVSPFSTRDITILHRLFRIKLEFLMPVSISAKDKKTLKSKIVKLQKPKLERALETA